MYNVYTVYTTPTFFFSGSLSFFHALLKMYLCIRMRVVCCGDCYRWLICLSLYLSIFVSLSLYLSIYLSRVCDTTQHNTTQHNAPPLYERPDEPRQDSLLGELAEVGDLGNDELLLLCALIIYGHPYAYTEGGRYR